LVQLQIPLINADRMVLSIIAELGSDGALDECAQTLRDTDESWMRVTQDGVQVFVGHTQPATNRITRCVESASPESASN
jgi:uncharacterized protein YaeQ